MLSLNFSTKVIYGQKISLNGDASCNPWTTKNSRFPITFWLSRIPAYSTNILPQRPKLVLWFTNSDLVLLNSNHFENF